MGCRKHHHTEKSSCLITRLNEDIISDNEFVLSAVPFFEIVAHMSIILVDSRFILFVKKNIYLNFYIEIFVEVSFTVSVQYILH